MALSRGVAALHKAAAGKPREDSFIYSVRMKTPQGQEFMGVKRINARGLAAVNKIMTLTAACYNLKKWLKFITPESNIKTFSMLQTKARNVFVHIKMAFAKLITRQNATLYFSTIPNYSL